MGLPYLPSTLICKKNVFGDILFCLPYLPIQKQSLLLNSYLHRIYWGIMKILIIREAFKFRLHLRITINNENPFQTTAKISSSSPYLEITILSYKYGLPYLPTYHKSICPNFFYVEKVWLEDTLPTYSLDICPNFRSFFPTLS